MSSSSLSRLVVFMVCLSVAGALVAGAIAVLGSSPAAVAPQTPQNSLIESPCVHVCSYNYVLCEADGILDIQVCASTFASCTNRCTCTDCMDRCNSEYTACNSQPKNSEINPCYGEYDFCTAGCSC